MLGRIHVQPDDVFELLDEPRVIGEFERLDPMWLEAMVAPDAGHGSGIGSQVLGQGARAPVRGALRCFVQSDAHHFLHGGRLASRSRTARARGVLEQTGHADL
jgi:hypothetical protein